MRAVAVLPLLAVALTLPNGLHAPHDHPPSDHGRGPLRPGAPRGPDNGAAAAHQPFLRGIALLNVPGYAPAADPRARRFLGVRADAVS